MEGSEGEKGHQGSQDSVPPVGGTGILDIGINVVENSIWEAPTCSTSMRDLLTLKETPEQTEGFMWHIPTQVSSEAPPKQENLSAVTSEGAGTWGNGLLSLLESWNYGIS